MLILIAEKKMKGERIAQLELLLRSHPEGIRRAEIARRMGVHRSTISRYVDNLSKHIGIYEENNLIKLRENDDESSPMELSVYESLAFNMGAEVLASTAEFANPHLASGLRKLAMNMRSYAPKISENALFLAERIDQTIQNNRNVTGHYNAILEVLIDCWVSGRIARISTSVPDKEEIEIAPYFIGYKEELGGRNPITVTGRLRHTKNIVTIPLSQIRNAVMIDETYTIPDNLKPFRRNDDEKAIDPVDMIPLRLRVKERSALNSLADVIHGEMAIDRESDGSYVCSFEAENSIELTLRLIQSGKSVEILAPESYRKKFVKYLKDILSTYESNC